jgi:uncharacterized protein with FMN-binding domain
MGKGVRLLLNGLLAALLLGCATARITGGPVPEGRLKDGVYDGTARNGPVRVAAKVTIRNQRIAAVELIKHRHWKGAEAERAIPARIIEAQSTRVDAVSGATASSTAIMNAVEAAVQKAR